MKRKSLTRVSQTDGLGLGFSISFVSAPNRSFRCFVDKIMSGKRRLYHTQWRPSSITTISFESHSCLNQIPSALLVRHDPISAHETKSHNSIRKSGRGSWYPVKKQLSINVPHQPSRGGLIHPINGVNPQPPENEETSIFSYQLSSCLQEIGACFVGA